jgi:hypothetical protein
LSRFFFYYEYVTKCNMNIICNCNRLPYYQCNNWVDLIQYWRQLVAKLSLTCIHKAFKNNILINYLSVLTKLFIYKLIMCNVQIYHECYIMIVLRFSIDGYNLCAKNIYSVNNYYREKFLILYINHSYFQCCI